MVPGMGIPNGITLIVGGGFHGKSTLLRALEMGCYNHIPGDGREFVSARSNTVKVRAEDGRSISCVDISPFINNLPFGKDTTRFDTTCASGSTSQATNVIEALECRTSLLLIDEDTSATNFMTRDRMMSLLIPSGEEPITPFLHHIKKLKDVSTIIVMGGSSDYFSVADLVIQMKSYQPQNVTKHVRDIVKQNKDYLTAIEEVKPFNALMRVPSKCVSPVIDGKVKIKTHQKEIIHYGTHEIDCAAVEQICDKQVSYAIAHAIYYIFEKMDHKNMTLAEIMEKLDKLMDGNSLDVLSYRNHPDGFFKRPRAIDVIACVNRIRGLQISPAKK